MAKDDKRIIQSIFTLACDNYRFHKRAKMAAAIVYRGEIISYGFNSDKTHPLQQKFAKNKFSVHLHAEIDAIKNALRRITVDQIKHSSLYIVRSKILSILDDTPITGLAKPCIGCLRAIHSFNINEVYYSLDGNKKDIILFDRM